MAYGLRRVSPTRQRPPREPRGMGNDTPCALPPRKKKAPDRNLLLRHQTNVNILIEENQGKEKRPRVISLRQLEKSETRPPDDRTGGSIQITGRQLKAEKNPNAFFHRRDRTHLFTANKNKNIPTIP